MSANHTTRYPKVRYYQRKPKQSPPKSPKKTFLERLSLWFWWLFVRLVFTYFIFMLGYIVGSPTDGRGLC